MAEQALMALEKATKKRHRGTGQVSSVYMSISTYVCMCVDLCECYRMTSEGSHRSLGMGKDKKFYFILCAFLYIFIFYNELN